MANEAAIAIALNHRADFKSVAHELGCSSSFLSRKLTYPLRQDEKERLIRAITTVADIHNKHGKAEDWMVKEKGTEPTDPTDIDVLNLSTRAYNGLVRVGVRTIGDLSLFNPKEWRSFRNIGSKTAEEIQTKYQHYLKFGSVMKEERMNEEKSYADEIALKSQYKTLLKEVEALKKQINAVEKSRVPKKLQNKKYQDLSYTEEELISKLVREYVFRWNYPNTVIRIIDMTNKEYKVYCEAFTEVFNAVNKARKQYQDEVRKIEPAHDNIAYELNGDEIDIGELLSPIDGEDPVYYVEQSMEETNNDGAEANEEIRNG